MGCTTSRSVIATDALLLPEGPGGSLPTMTCKNHHQHHHHKSSCTTSTTTTTARSSVMTMPIDHSSSLSTTAADGEETCPVCLEAPTNRSFLPCGHSLCQEHVAKCHNKCPVCRHVIDETVAPLTTDLSMVGDDVLVGVLLRLQESRRRQSAIDNTLLAMLMMDHD